MTDDYDKSWYATQEKLELELMKRQAEWLARYWRITYEAWLHKCKMDEDSSS